MKALSFVERLLATSLLRARKERSKPRLSELAACILLLAAPLAAKSWRVADFQDNIVVAGDGSAVVTERITLVFVGEWHGIHRTIPIEYPGPNGTNYEFFLKVTSVTDGSGGKLKYDSSTADGARDLKIYIPDAVDTTRTVEIVYRVRNGTRFFDSHDEFYWNVTGNDWPVPIDHAAAHGAIPAPLPRDLCERRHSPACTARRSTMRPPISTALRRSLKPAIRCPCAAG